MIGCIALPAIIQRSEMPLNHSGTPIFTHDNKNQAYQDFIVLLSRYPTVDSHPSHKFDSMNSHPDLPLTLYLNQQA